jgi:DNA-binding transcriptional ArsR family regulator
MKQKDVEKLVRHPARVRIVALLAERKMSPNEIAEELGLTLGTTAYHVRKMAELGAIRLVNEKRVRGAIEHFYTLRKTEREIIKKAVIKMAKEQAAAEKALSAL